SGQQDAELYTRAAEEHPGRLRAIFIRDADPQTATDRDEGVRACATRAAAVGGPVHVGRDSVAAGGGRVGLGPAPPTGVPGVVEERDADRARPEETLTQTAAEAAGVALPESAESAPPTA